ncbi:MAG: transcription factor S [Nanoarchaeota archaeon]
MEFCPKCGGMLMIDGDKAPTCAKCGYRHKGKLKLQASEKMAVPERIAVVDESKLTTLPIVEIKCPDCKHKEAYFWTMQTRSSDESETKFYKCTKCEHTWRIYR